MKQSKIIVAGIGPGNEQDITPAVITALQEADAVVGYKYYFRFVKIQKSQLIRNTLCMN